MAENLQEQLELKIQKKEPVKATEVADAYSQTVENRRKEYLEKGGKPEDFEKSEKAFMETAKDLRKRQLETIGNLKKDYAEKQLQILEKSREATRDENFRISAKRGWDLTNPDADKVEIVDDYDGTGDDNRYGFGRTSLAGYLAALQFTDPSRVPAVVKEGKDYYDKTSSWGDHYLSDDSIREMIGKKYLDQLKSIDLTDEARAYLATYLKQADEKIKNSTNKDAYKKYLLEEQLPKLLKDLTADPKYPRGTTYDEKNKRAALQLNAFLSIKTPAEWQQSLQERLQRTFETFKGTCDTLLSANPDFKFQDASITAVLGKKLDDLTVADIETLSSATEKARQEIYNSMAKKKDEIAQENDNYTKTADALKTRNKALKMPVVTDEDWQKVDTLLSQRNKDLDNVVFVQSTSLEDLGAMWGRLAMARSSGGLLKITLEDDEKKIKDSEEKEPAIAKFMAEKNLTEKYDETAKQYQYALDGRALSFENGKIALISKNPEVKKFYESKVKALSDKLKADDPDFQAIQKITEQAEKDCIFSFDHRPTADELQKSYTEKFAAIWEKAAKDFDGKITVPVAPAVTPGGGEQPANPEQPLRFPDEYGDRWNQGKEMPMPEQFQGYDGGLFVAVNSIRLRDEQTGRQLDWDVAGRATQGNRDITLADSKGNGWQVGDTLFIKINYQGKKYYVPAEYVGLNEPGTQRRVDIPSGAPATVPEAKNTNDVPALGNVNIEYAVPLAHMKEVDKSPRGVRFNILYNKTEVPCLFTKVGPDNYALQFGLLSMTYRSIQEAMMALNNGYILQALTLDTLKKQANYKPYEKLIDDFKEDVSVSLQGEAYFELDWKGRGRGEGNAQVWATPTVYGGIAFHIRRNHVGLQGENDRYGFAANFDDFMKQIGHIKNWSENYQDNLEDKKITQTVKNREWLFANISDPRIFYAHESTIGRPVSFDILSKSETVHMYLDWGGGAARDFKLNPMVNVWAGPDGLLHYIVNFQGKGISRQGTVTNPDELFTLLAQIKNDASNTKPKVP